MQRNQETMDEHREFAQKFKALKNGPGGEEPPSPEKGGRSQLATPRGGVEGAVQQTLKEGQIERRHQALFGAPGGPGTALATFRPPSLTPRQTPQATPRSNPAMSYRSQASTDVSRTPRLQQAGNMIGIGSSTYERSEDGTETRTMPVILPLQGSFQLRLQAMQMNAQRNAEQLDTQRSFLDEILALRAKGKESHHDE